MSQPTQKRPELFFALVGPAGVRLDDLSRVLKERLRDVQYEPVDVRLSELLRNYTGWKNEADSSEFTRITHRQEIAHAFRLRLNDGAALVRAGIAEIRDQRAIAPGSPDTPAQPRAYIIQQLKHPAEVELLRQVYGTSFFLLAGHAPRTKRADRLAEQMSAKDNKPGQKSSYLEKAEHVIEIDDKQDGDDELGQNTRDTYPLADFFANLGVPLGENAISRFIELLFGHPFHTPTPDEYAMYQASAVALRSSDESRQVGAVIVNLTYDVTGARPTNADVVTSGMNEVPRRGGGFYWDGDSPDGRDQWLIANTHNGNRAQQIKISALAELIERVQKKNWLGSQVKDSDPNQLAQDLLPDLKRTQFMDIGEFMRPVHAEMAALIDGAKRGVAVNGLTMYVTTFPCHNCAKHIIAAGLRRVVYLEPYPKSRAAFLHEEEINLDSPDGLPHDDRVAFSAYSGIAPRMYSRLFSMSARGAKRGVSLSQWYGARSTLSPQSVMRNAAESYLAAEKQELERLTKDVYRKPD